MRSSRAGLASSTQATPSAAQQALIVAASASRCATE
jgi:hypothetical protein